jgi:hypothetical protein
MFKAKMPGSISRVWLISMVVTGSNLFSVAAHAVPALSPAGSHINEFTQRLSDNIQDSPYDIGQLELLKAQIHRQQESGNHAVAVENIDRALHLLRVDGGPENPAQLPLMEQRLDSLQALGHLAEIDQQYQAILHLYRNQFGADDIRTATLLGRIAQWQMAVFYDELQNTSGVIAGAGTDIERRAQAFDMLAQSQLNLIDAVRTHVKAGNWPSEDLQQLEENLLESYFLFAWRDSLVNDPDHYLLDSAQRWGSVYRRVDMNAPQYVQAFQQGQLVLERLMTYQQQSTDRNPAAEGKVLVAMADWHLLFGHNKEALSLYRDATQRLVTQPDQFSHELDPGQPVLLPTFTRTAAGPFSTQFEEGSDYIDVSFSVTRYGRARNIEITGCSRQQDDEVQKQLMKWLKQGQFRPRFVGDEIDESQLTLRYYYQ